MRYCVVRQAEYCRLDCREVTTRANQNRVLRATVQWLLSRILARFAVDSRYSSACLEQAKEECSPMHGERLKFPHGPKKDARRFGRLRLGLHFISTHRIRTSGVGIPMWLKTSAMPGYLRALSTIISRKCTSSINYPSNASNQHHYQVYRAWGVSTQRDPENVGKMEEIIHQLSRSLTSLGDDLTSPEEPTNRRGERAASHGQTPLCRHVPWCLRGFVALVKLRHRAY